MNFLFHPEAETEFAQAIEYYEEKEEGLGYDFAVEVYITIERIFAYSKAWPILEGEIRRSLVKRFPYGILYAEEDEKFNRQLRDRLSKFGLTLHEGKTRLIEFGRFAAINRRKRGLGKPESFDILGFTHLCDTRLKDGKFKLTRLTISQRLPKKLKEIKFQVKRKRHENAHEQGKWLRSVLNAVQLLWSSRQQGGLECFSYRNPSDVVQITKTEEP